MKENSDNIDMNKEDMKDMKEKYKYSIRESGILG